MKTACRDPSIMAYHQLRNLRDLLVRVELTQPTKFDATGSKKMQQQEV